MKRATLVLAALALLVGGVEQAKAGYIQDHASAAVIGQFSSPSVSFGDFFGSTDTGPLTASASGNGQLTATASGSASASVSVTPVPGGGYNWEQTMQASASGDPQARIDVLVTAKATWRDILFLSTTDPNIVGNTLRLNFISFGSLEGTGNALFFAETEKDAIGSNIFNETTDAKTIAHAAIEFTSGWDFFSGGVNGGYVGTYHLDIPIVPGGGYLAGIPGSFYYEVDSIVRANAVTTAFASDPMHFVSITLPDKGNVTPESLGVSLTFDSGIVSPNLATPATPEPSSLALLGIGAAGLTGYGWSRRKRTKA